MAPREIPANKNNDLIEKNCIRSVLDGCSFFIPYKSLLITLSSWESTIINGAIPNHEGYNTICSFNKGKNNQKIRLVGEPAKLTIHQGKSQRPKNN
jgi:hypothetical protein